MANDSLFTSLLEDSFSDVDTSIENYSSKLKDALEKLVEKFDVEYLQQALQECLSSCSNDSLDKKIFSEILPLVHRLLSQILKQIPEVITANAEDARENVNRQLTLCHELLNVKEKSVERVSTFQKTSATSFRFLIENVLVSIKLIFEHCRESKKLYETLFEAISEKLAILFRKAKTILSLFLATLESVIVFDTDKESETELLIKVIDSIGSLVIISHELDAKTFVDTSKMFGKLAIMHELHIKRMKGDGVTSHLADMTKHASKMLLLLQNSLDKADERKVKVIGHTLKILDRLFATYCSCLNNDILLPIIELLLQMHRCNPSCLKEAPNDKVIELINVHISRGAEPFLNTIFEASDFKQMFFEYGNQTGIDKLGYHLLIISIMKKLIGMPYERHSNWTLGSESVIDVALRHIDNIQEDICVGDIKLPGAHEIGETPRQASLYEATLVPICSLISQIPADGFHAIELILLKHLLSNRLWSSLLSSDVWCFIGRIGSSELCASHVKYLLKVYAALTKRGNSLEVIMLENLIGRLYSLLSEDTRHNILTELEDLENPSWLPLARFFSPETKSFLQNRLACVLNDIPSTFAELQRQPTVQNWNHIMVLMSIIGKLNYAVEKHTIDIISQVWNSIANTIEYCEERQLDILSGFVAELFNATKPESIQDDTFLTILEAVLTSFLCFPPHVKVIASHYLRNNINSFGNCGVKSSNALAELNCRLLEDENPWVRQEALESFDHVAHMCPNEDLVTTMAAAVTRKPLLNSLLPAYLSGAAYYKLQDFPGVRFYLQHVARNANNTCHVCCIYEDSQRDEKLAKLETESVENSNESASVNDMDGQVNKLCDGLIDISKRHDEISDHALQRLRSVCAKMLDLIEPVKRS